MPIVVGCIIGICLSYFSIRRSIKFCHFNAIIDSMELHNPNISNHNPEVSLVFICIWKTKHRLVYRTSPTPSTRSDPKTYWSLIELSKIQWVQTQIDIAIIIIPFNWPSIIFSPIAITEKTRCHNISGICWSFCRTTRVSNGVVRIYHLKIRSHWNRVKFISRKVQKAPTGKIANFRDGKGSLINHHFIQLSFKTIRIRIFIKSIYRNTGTRKLKLRGITIDIKFSRIFTCGHNRNVSPLVFAT